MPFVVLGGSAGASLALLLITLLALLPFTGLTRLYYDFNGRHTVLNF